MLQEGRYWSLWRSQTEEGDAAVPRPPLALSDDEPSADHPASLSDRPNGTDRLHTLTLNGDGHA